VFPTSDKTKPAFILELKKTDTRQALDETHREKMLNDALAQIQTKAYHTDLTAKGYQQIIELAILGSGKQVWVKQAR